MILGQNVAVLALGPSPTGHFPDKQKILRTSFCQRCPKYVFSQFCSASPEIIGVQVCHRRTDRQTNSLTPYATGVCGFFLPVKFEASLLALLAGG